MESEREMGMKLRKVWEMGKTMKIYGTVCTTTRPPTILALSAAPAFYSFAGIAFAGTEEGGQERMVTQKQIFAVFHYDVQSSLYQTADETSIEILW